MIRKSILAVNILLFQVFINTHAARPQMLPAESSALDSLRNSLLTLTWSETEVGNILDIIDGKAYVYGQATEKMFKAHAPEAGILHLATHAVIDDQNPSNSQFVFAADGDSAEDGFLHASELYNMQLNAELAVLSACNTGMGKLSKGEGIMSLARGFMYAGVPSVVVSLWPIDDQSTAALAGNFYRGLRDGLDKDEALRQAKLAHLNNADEIKAAPLYWAGFISIGNPNRITASHALKPPIWGMAVSGLLLGAITLYALRRKIAVMRGLTSVATTNFPSNHR